MKILKSAVIYWAFCLALLLGAESSSLAQPCGLTFSPNPGPATVKIESYWVINNYASPANPAVFKDTVTAGNPTVPTGTYLGWCIDTTDSIDNGPESYSVLMFSSCDPNLDTELANLGYTYHFSYPPSDTNTSAAQWNQLNYILNHKLSGASYWDVQAAIWNIVGGPLPPNSYYHSNFSSTLTYDTNNVSEMTQDALTHAASWQPQCGDVIAVILAITAPDDQYHDFPVQLTIIQVPFPCPLGCYPSLAAADAAARTTAGDSANCGGTPNLTVSDNGQFCPATITASGTNACGNPVIAIYTATVLTNPPTLIGLPPMTATYSCYSDVPAAPTVTAINSCGDSLTVVATTNETFPQGTSCNGTITLTWTATDCANQTTTFTQTITVQDDTLPVLTTNAIASCYTSLGAADAAAMAATSGTADCGVLVNFTVSDNGQTCPATITVTGTDTCGRSSTATYMATILTGQPTLSSYPADTNVECASQIPVAPVVTATDSCNTTLSVTTNQTESNPGSTCSNVITRTWSATDCVGQTVNWTQVITQLNNLVPTANTGTIASCYTSLSAADAAALAATTAGTVGCGSGLTFTVSDNGQTCPATISVKGTDGCSNSVTVTYTATILTALPTLSSYPANTTVQCASQIPAAPPVTATDSCGTVLSVTTNQTESNPNSTCTNVITRTWSATDCAGQPVSWTQVITQADNVVPTANTGTIASCYTSLSAADAAALAATTAGTVGCGGSLTFTVSDNGQTCPATITVTGTDGCGNSVAVTYTATILTNPPTLSSYPANTTVQCASQIPAAPPVTATDSCGTVLSVTTNQTETNPNSTCTNVITRTWSATDCAGQPVSWTQVITQADNVVPTANTGTIASCYTSLSAADAAALAATTAGTVGCGSRLTFTVSDNGQTCPATISVKGTDGCGNSVTVTYTATVLTHAPTLHGLPPLTASYQCYSQVPPAPLVTATDACGTALTVTPTASETIPGSSCGNVITRSWATVDCAGQPASFTQTITVQNTTPPTLGNVPAGGNLGCNPTLPTDSTATNGVTVTTACGTAPASFGVTHADVTSGCTVTRTYTITATDTCGNSGGATVVYTWMANTTPPTITGVPANAFLGCNGATNLPSDTMISNDVHVTSTCGTAAYTVTHVDATNGCLGTRIFTITASETCGNTATATVTYSWTVNGVGPTITCPSNVTVVTNFCQMYCTFTCGDWGGSCNGGYPYNNNWWQHWCSQNPPSECWPSWVNWWNSCGGNNNQCSNFWNCWNNNHPTNWWGCWSGNQGDGQGGNQWGEQGGNQWGEQGGGQWGGNWWGSWNCGNGGKQGWVPCGGNNPDSILGSCFNKVYPNGCVTVGQPGGNCVTFTSCSAVHTCLNFGGNPGVLNRCATNPASCNAGSFCAQVLALRLNCDFGDYGCAPGFVGKCGDLVLCDPTSPCNGKKVRDILNICNGALGGGPCPHGCSVQYLCGLCGNLNQCFEGCQVSGWCGTHLCSVYIPSPAVTGTPTVSDACSPNPTLTYCDSVSAGSCPATYVISREWIAVDACGNSNTCTQLITVAQTNSCAVSGVVVLAGCSGDTNLCNNEGISNVVVTLENSQGNPITAVETGANGSYSFGSLAPGSYIVVVTPPSGYTETYPAVGGNNQADVTVAPCQFQAGVNFAYTGSTPGVQLIKTAPCFVPCSGTITYCFAVTNTGNACETLTVLDPLLGGAIFSQTGVEPGHGFLFRSNYVVGSATGTLTNTASAIGTTSGGRSATNTSTVTTVITTRCLTNSICGGFNSQNPGGGWVWCNAHISCNPGKKCTVYCQGASVTLTCNDGHTYTYPVPDCQINFSPTCSVGSCGFDGTKWTTTLPCAGDDEIFLSGCGIPWQSDFANCHSVCWNGTFSCDTSGISCNWQWSAACYNENLGNCGSINVKPCHNIQCGYPGGDHAGTPENCKPYCQGGACGGGGGNYTGSWSGTGSFSCH